MIPIKSLFAGMLLLTTGNTFAQDIVTAYPVDNQRQVAPATGAASTLPVIPEKDIVWKKRVWRDIDAREPGNSALMYTPGSPISNILVNILASGILSGTIKAYSATDDIFSTVLAKEELSAMLSPANFKPEKIYKYRVKEDWLFVSKGSEQGKMTVRLVGIAPVTEVKNADGTITEKPLFWIYWPDSRDFLGKQQLLDVSNSGNVPKTWLSYFENRQFKSKIDKVGNLSKPRTQTAENKETTNKIEGQFEEMNQPGH